ncbi:MAG: hypothetical protein ACI9SP_000610 [Arenicella sp.]|jgi:hypothetical protein
MNKQLKSDNTLAEKQQKAGVTTKQQANVKAHDVNAKTTKPVRPLAKEINGPKGLEPTRYGDWESKGRCYDF